MFGCMGCCYHIYKVIERQKIYQTKQERKMKIVNYIPTYWLFEKINKKHNTQKSILEHTIEWVHKKKTLFWFSKFNALVE